MSRTGLELGLGLVSIGRTWGVRQVQPPAEADAFALLEKAVALGIRVFDTAPAYGTSEARLGAFLATLPPAGREPLVIMTKAGEHWDEERAEPFVDHRRDALVRSIDRSLERLGRVDVLQIHKATQAIVTDPDVLSAIAYARSCGIERIGASVSDVAAGEAALAAGCYGFLQFPLNTRSGTMLPLLAPIEQAGATPVINRPFGMGALLDGDRDEAARRAFRHLDDHVRSGIVLTGTSRADHLAFNVEAFRTRRS
ncbi:MAG TPA: aldo/keto reductase [Microvirga sp.]|jgi:aryl-alcohol dehydrogenase-like predicted oxidoreductase|nr:aldo/keto reductase [Microvirga sp.]